MMGSTMAAFWAGVVLIRLVRRIVIGVGVDENLRSKSIALLEIESTGVAEGLERRRISPPERRLGRLAVRASLDVGSRRARTLYTAERSRRSMRFCLNGNRGVGLLIHRRWGAGVGEAVGEEVMVVGVTQKHGLLRGICGNGAVGTDDDGIGPLRVERWDGDGLA
jgi:hypothetical protein